MPIVGNLSEFPLPEVMLFIGHRTGRLRLLDVPEFGVLDIDIAKGEVQTMRIGTSTFIETLKMLDKLCAIVQSQSGMFEFRVGPVSLAVRPQAQSIHDLAMELVCHVDKKVAQLSLGPGADQRYRLVSPEPEIWMDPELNEFFYAIRPFLNEGMPADDMALRLRMETGPVYKNLADLQSLGLIELIDSQASVDAEVETSRRGELAQKSQAFLRTAQLSMKMRKLTSRIPLG